MSTFTINSLDEEGNHQDLIDDLFDDGYEDIGEILALNFFGHEKTNISELTDEDIDHIKEVFSRHFRSFDITIDGRRIDKFLIESPPSSPPPDKDVVTQNEEAK